jgi:transcriptional regulator with XRE-family HTH domain
MPTTPTDDLTERLKDPEYAKLYGEEDAKLEFAVTLTRVRRDSNLTQDEIANKIGVSQPYIAKLEGGEANPTIGRIGSLLAILGRRLVTHTAPLLPEKVSPDIELLWSADSGITTSMREEPYGADYGGIYFPKPKHAYGEAPIGGAV